MNYWWKNGCVNCYKNFWMSLSDGLEHDVSESLQVCNNSYKQQGI